MKKRLIITLYVIATSVLLITQIDISKPCPSQIYYINAQYNSPGDSIGRPPPCTYFRIGWPMQVAGIEGVIEEVPSGINFEKPQQLAIGLFVDFAIVLIPTAVFIIAIRMRTNKLKKIF